MRTVTQNELETNVINPIISNAIRLLFLAFHIYNPQLSHSLQFSQSAVNWGVWRRVSFCKHESAEALGDGSESTDEADLGGGGHRFLPELLKPSARRVNMDLIYASLKRAKTYCRQQSQQRQN